MATFLTAYILAQRKSITPDLGLILVTFSFLIGFSCCSNGGLHFQRGLQQLLTLDSEHAQWARKPSLHGDESRIMDPGSFCILLDFRHVFTYIEATSDGDGGSTATSQSLTRSLQHRCFYCCRCGSALVKMFKVI